MSPLRSRLSILASVVALSMAVVACSDDEPQDDVIFGSGSMPASFPRDFPVPPDAVILSTLIDRRNHRSEVNMNVRAELVPAVQFFQVGLVNQGYVVERSERGDGDEWQIEFTRGEMRGTIDITYGVGLSVVQIQMNVS